MKRNYKTLKPKVLKEEDETLEGEAISKGGMDETFDAKPSEEKFGSEDELAAHFKEYLEVYKEEGPEFIKKALRQCYDESDEWKQIIDDVKSAEVGEETEETDEEMEDFGEDEITMNDLPE